MRLTSRIFVDALIRRAGSRGLVATLLRRGADDAGAIFIQCRARNGEVSLFAPMPQIMADAAHRAFECVVEDGDPVAVDHRLAQEMRFDSDIFVVEIEADRTVVAELLEP